MQDNRIAFKIYERDHKEWINQMERESIKYRFHENKNKRRKNLNNEQQIIFLENYGHI